MIIVKDKGVVISRGYRLEVSRRHEENLELAFYEKGKREFIESIPAIWIPIVIGIVCLAAGFAGGYVYRRNIAEAKIANAEEAVKKIFEK